MLATQGYAAASVKAPLAPFSFERRDLKDDDVQIDIKFCGICHSDIHQARDEWGGSIFPMVPGHEIAGVVAAVGSKVTKYKVGDHVGVGCMVDSCRTCTSCQRDLEQYCVTAPPNAPPCSARGSRSIRRSSTGAPGRARRWRSSAWVGSGTWG